MLTCAAPETVEPEAGDTLSQFPDEVEAVAVKLNDPDPAFETEMDCAGAELSPGPARNCRPAWDNIRYGPGAASASVIGTFRSRDGPKPTLGEMVIATLAV